MTRRQPKFLLLGVLAMVTALSAPVLAADPPAGQAAQPLYGHQLMTEQERVAQMERMRAARTEQEREQIREEHHRLMQQRAQERGVTLPDQPMMGGGGMGRGGMGQGRGGGR
ncbi:MAG: hypothetical protein KDG52_14190 [Rhodocyclaceae bacterium]|nr:hypothetical protein [Rhodocyclaceae bacterium]